MGEFVAESSFQYSCEVMNDVKHPLVSLYGIDYLNNDWTLECMKSWSNITNIPFEDTYIIPEKEISEKEHNIFSDLGFKTAHFEIVIAEALSKYPNIQFIRENDVTWRKLIDSTVLFPNATTITIIDTDVFIKNKVELPLEQYDIIYMREDIPAYRANWKLVWEHKMVAALNAGLVIFNPKIIDFNFLEEFIQTYIKNCKKFWWSEQSAWSVIAGKSKKRGVFSGKQVRVTSAMKSRSPQEMIANKFKYFGGSKMITKYEEFFPYLEGGSIFHFAGPGKYLFKESLPYLLETKEENVLISIEEDPTLNFVNKAIISARLFLKEI